VLFHKKQKQIEQLHLCFSDSRKNAQKFKVLAKSAVFVIVFYLSQGTDLFYFILFYSTLYDMRQQDEDGEGSGHYLSPNRCESITQCSEFL
jgi:hypothetical protein